DPIFLVTCIFFGNFQSKTRLHSLPKRVETNFWIQNLNSGFGNKNPSKTENKYRNK
ncbi:hypothetical protein A4A49_53440, partial [Nicotiana attenuata]